MATFTSFVLSLSFAAGVLAFSSELILPRQETLQALPERMPATITCSGVLGPLI